MMKFLKFKKKVSEEERLREILRKVRKIDISTRKIVQEIFSGQYHSVFRGRGMEFSEVREYLAGDDIRSIDWNVTARMNQAYVKRYEEERELTVIIAADMSRSSAFGTQNQIKREIAVEIAAMLAFSAIENSDLVGLLMFTENVEKFIPPQKGRTHSLRIIRELLGYEPTKKNTDIPLALDYLNKILKRKSIIFFISDFLDENLQKPLLLMSKKHDFIPVVISDPAEMAFSGAGVVVLEDAETGEMLIVDTSDKSVADYFAKNTSRELETQDKLFSQIGVEPVRISTDGDYAKTLRLYFKKRSGRVR